MDLASYYQLKGKSENAIKLFQFALEICETESKEFNFEKILKILLGIAKSYQDMREFKKTLESLIRLEKIFKSLQMQNSISSIYIEAMLYA